MADFGGGGTVYSLPLRLIRAIFRTTTNRWREFTYYRRRKDTESSHTTSHKLHDYKGVSCIDGEEGSKSDRV
eukprot:scaffold181578_cov13-Prasinocladus_malaysianus.AAC.1